MDSALDCHNMSQSDTTDLAFFFRNCPREKRLHKSVDKSRADDGYTMLYSILIPFLYLLNLQVPGHFFSCRLGRSGKVSKRTTRGDCFCPVSAQFFSWQATDESGGGLHLLQTCEDAQMVYAFDLCSKHLGADMQQATTVAVRCDNRFSHEWEKHGKTS